MGDIRNGLAVYHNGPIIIHGKSKIGESCSLHGDNCIGNDEESDDCSVIVAHVDIGVGAKVIGNVHIADRCIIGAGAVVLSDFLDEGSIGYSGRFGSQSKADIMPVTHSEMEVGYLQ